MLYLLLSLVALGLVAALLGQLRNRRLAGQMRRGEIQAMPEVQERPAGCCGLHAVCERTGKAAVEEPDYYDDEELDRFRGTPSGAYAEEAANEFREVLYTLREEEVPAWLCSLQMRGVELPDSVKDEAYLIVGEQMQTA
ncbi:MAG: phospholipase [Tannerella sp.]|jgi:hypothetical protein|nr:phospholipase [Tannerella sp.]